MGIGLVVFRIGLRYQYTQRKTEMQALTEEYFEYYAAGGK
jgi:hypothetical protein